MLLLNKKLLVSGADYFTSDQAINALMNDPKVDHEKALKEHALIMDAFEKVGIKVIKVSPPENCQDGIYTANWALVKDNKAIMSRLPNTRKPEEEYAKKTLEKLGIETFVLPEDIKSFSGQGDALICDDFVFTQSPYRTSKDAHRYISEVLHVKNVISLHTKPLRWFRFGPPKKNKITKWPDSPTYDIDLAIAILRPKTNKNKALIAYCPEVFDRRSNKILSSLKDFDKIIVSKEDAVNHFALNLVSTGETVIINSGTLNFNEDLMKYGFKVIELNLPELKKGGGSIRCSSLDLSA
jgi:N-dimethylarginine dimethylaminohydrolase